MDTQILMFLCAHFLQERICHKSVKKPIQLNDELTQKETTQEKLKGYICKGYYYNSTPKKHKQVNQTCKSFSGKRQYYYDNNYYYW